VIAPATPPDPWKLLAAGPASQERILRVLAAVTGPCVGDRYRHWDRLRRLTPPKGLSHEEWWAGLWMARRPLRQPVPLLGSDGRPFTITSCDPMLRYLHELDRDLGGRTPGLEETRDPASRDQHLFAAMVEEAFRSSQLEGASTTRRVATEMLRSGRQPQDEHERMIYNNLRAMHFIRDHRKHRLSEAMIQELHRIVTEGTLESADQAGRYRLPEERVVVEDATTGEVLHVPPEAGSMPARIRRLCAFANGEDAGHFVHPIARAILIHFGLAYDHPFTDGNGRTARALFYWSLLHDGYDLAEFLSVSQILKKAPARYSRAFLYTETDGGDATYFVLFHLEVLLGSVQALHAFLARRKREMARTYALLRSSGAFNHRQVALLGHALKDPDEIYTFRSHARSHGVVLQSSRRDLLDLEARGLLQRRRTGRTFQFVATKDLERHLLRLAPRSGSE
jgi:Fic family protein